MHDATDYGARQCPACKASADSARQEIGTDVPAETLDFDALRDQWFGFFKEKSLFSYHRCGRCGMLYAPTYFTNEQLERLYASMPANMSEVSDDALNRTQFGYFRELHKVAALEGQFLEIGPDVGLFARHCRENGRFEQFWMFEPNIDAHDELRKTLEGSSFEISTELLDLSNVPDGQVSVAAMIHVLDHILDPVEFLAHLRKKLRPEATLLIVTHDERSALAKILRKRWPAYCLQHPHLFNAESMRNLLAAAGFDVIKIVKSTNYFPVTFLAKHALFALGMGKTNLPAMSGIQLPLRLGNFITFATPASRG
ncbi:hypothetical protein A9W94_20390 [Mycobacterium asiaticum]|nr:hypothetical protein A9W94_20390 [Mycobacterium asiaticum]